MTREALIRAAHEELRRQSQEDRHDSPWVGNLEGEEVVVDGNVNLRALIEALIVATSEDAR